MRILQKRLISQLDRGDEAMQMNSEVAVVLIFVVLPLVAILTGCRESNMGYADLPEARKAPKSGARRTHLAPLRVSTVTAGQLVVVEYPNVIIEYYEPNDNEQGWND